jgi:hypothetical protein
VLLEEATALNLKIGHLSNPQRPTISNDYEDSDSNTLKIFKLPKDAKRKFNGVK